MDSISRWKDDTPPTDTNMNNVTNNSRSFSPSHNTVIYNPNSSNKSADTNKSRTDSVAKSPLDNNNSNRSGQQLDSNSNRLKDTQRNQSNNSRKHSSIVNINNNTSWVSTQSNETKLPDEKNKSVEGNDKRDSFEWGKLDGWNPVIDRLTGLRNESYCLAIQNGDMSIMNGRREHPSRMHQLPNALRHNIRSPPPQHNVIIEEDYGPNKLVLL